MDSAARRYIAIETAISIAINAALSIGFAWMIFGGRATIDPGARDVLLDMLPQSFMVAFMATLVPTLLTRKRLSAGRVAPLPGVRRMPRSSVLRALAAGLLAAALGTALFALLRPQALVPFVRFVLGKAIYGALLALAVTPLALRAALRDPPRRA